MSFGFNAAADDVPFTADADYLVEGISSVVKCFVTADPAMKLLNWTTPSISLVGTPDNNFIAVCPVGGHFTIPSVPIEVGRTYFVTMSAAGYVHLYLTEVEI